MFSKRTLTIIKREIRNKLLSKSFVFMTVLIPVFMFGILGFQTFLYSYKEAKPANIIIASDSPQIISALQNEISTMQEAKTKLYSFTFSNINEKDLQSFLKDKKADILNEKVTGIIYAGSSSLKDKKISYYSKNPKNNDLLNKFSDPVNKALTGIYFTGRGINTADLNFAQQKVDFSGYKVSTENKIEKEGMGNTIVAFLFSFLIYFSLIYLGMMMMRAVVEEKNNRIVEVLLSSAESKEIMAGKIIGNAIVGLIQMIIWLSPLMVVASSTIFALPPEFAISISLGHILYVIFNFCIALVTFLGLYTAVGAMFDNEQDSQSSAWPLMLLVMIPFFISLSLQENPDTTLARVSSLLPFASLMVMPVRTTLVDVPLWEVALSVVINIAVLLVIFSIAGKIYRVGILITGKKPSWSEIRRWLKYS